MARITTKEEFAALEEGGKILGKILKTLTGETRAGVTTNALEERARKLIAARGANPSFLGYRGYPTALCTSVNEEIVHGVPSERVLKEGDIVKLDLGIWYKGFATDAALTVGIGALPGETKRLLDVTRGALDKGIAVARAGNTTGDIGHAIERVIQSAGFVTFKELCGHGVGKDVHEPPLIPNFGKAGSGVTLEEGMVLAIEPMAGLSGSGDIVETEDGFGYRSKEGAFTAHFEHTVIVTKGVPKIVTTQ